MATAFIALLLTLNWWASQAITVGDAVVLELAALVAVAMALFLDRRVRS